MPWNPVVDISPETRTHHNVIGTLAEERANPVALVSLTQQYAGVTLKTWWKSASLYEKDDVLHQISVIFEKLTDLQVVHNDVHGRNLCINKNNEVSLIDFGWCLHFSFDMNPQEQEEYEQKLSTNFDLTHFLDSLQWDGIDVNA